MSVDIPRPRLTHGAQNNVALLKWKGSATMGKPIDFEGHDGYISGLKFRSNASELLSGAGDGYAKLWDVAKKQCKTTFTGHTQVRRLRRRAQCHAREDTPRVKDIIIHSAARPL